MLEMASAPCAYCKLELGVEPFVKINDQTYHHRCWVRVNTGLKNKRGPTGALLCPGCDRPVRIGDAKAFREDYALHIACAPVP